MANDEDRYIGRRIVGAVVEEFLAAIWANVIDLEIGAENPPFAAGGAAAPQALADGLPDITGGLGAPSIMYCVLQWSGPRWARSGSGIIATGHIDEFRNVIWNGQQPHPVLLWNTEALQPQLSQSEPDGQPLESSHLTKPEGANQSLNVTWVSLGWQKSRRRFTCIFLVGW